MTASLRLPRRFVAAPGLLLLLAAAGGGSCVCAFWLLLRLKILRFSRSVSAADDGGRAVGGSVLVLSCSDGLRVPRLLGGLGGGALAGALEGRSVPWLVLGLLISLEVLVKAEAGVEVNVGSEGFSRSLPWLLLRRRIRPTVFCPNLLAGDGDIREREGDAMPGDSVGGGPDVTGDSVRLLRSSPWVTVRLPEDAECMERGLVIVSADVFLPLMTG